MKIKKIIGLLLVSAATVSMLALPVSASISSDFTIESGVLIAYKGSGGAVTIPNTVTSIGEGAFSDCTGLTSVTIPSSVTSIGNEAFNGCNRLTSITIPNRVPSVGDYAFCGCTGLTSVTIPTSVTSIGDDAFGCCTSLTSVTIPSSVTSIGDYAFDACTGLTSVTIPSSVTSIGGKTFYYCTSLTSFTIPSNVTSIGDSAFSNCTGLTSVTIPSSVTSIGDYAFAYCNKLTSIAIPDSVKSIGADAFHTAAYISTWDLTTSSNTITPVFYVSIYGNQGSYAQTYAKKTCINFYLIAKQKPLITIDKPNGTYTGDITVSGWAASVYGVANVDIYVDGTNKFGSVSNSKLTERTDIESVYGGRGYIDLKHSGFSYTISKGRLTNGTHTICVALIDKKGKVTWSVQKQFMVKV